MTNKTKNILKTLAVIFTIIIVCSGVFFASYNYFVNNSYSSYEKSIVTEINSINSINNNIKQYIGPEKINKEKLLSELPNDIKNLKTISTNINKMNAVKKYISDHNNLESGVYSNISLLSEILYIVENLDKMDLDSSISRLQNFRDDTINNYCLINIANTKLTLNDEIIQLVSNTSFFINTLEDRNDTENLENDQNKDFLNLLDRSSSKFSEYNKTYATNIKSSRNGIQSYDSIISLIQKNIVNITSLQNEVSHISVPKDGIDAHNSLLKTMNQYKSYLYDLKFAIQNEKLISTESDITTERLDSLYNTPNKEYNLVTKEYNNFIKLHESFKNLII
ncbi:hypothetical protein SH2C18_10200 [Clostridium sediminicola]|uniref:hypothetical protein n=1 Tax=Clostridium sediminicola TaxID=3114879 RepID=UPI0031F2451C